ncbi:MAG: hypothetical protein D6683_06780 [Actinomyces sp.]|nr:MAG: hypothetical protein D6683_06780 [Actinomyces sp.]
MGRPLPEGIDDIDAAWLAEVTGLDIDTIAVEQIGVGIGVSSAVYRVRLEGRDCPPTLIVKLPALAPEAVFTSTVLRMYVREVRFFERLAARSPIRVPTYWYADVDPEGGRFVVVMEDLGHCRSVDQIVGMEAADAARAVDELAAWHAAFWGEAEALVDEGVAVSLGDPIYPAVLPAVFAEGWEKVTTGLDLAPEVLTVGPRWTDLLPGLLDRLASGPTTVAHGDYRADNIFFADDGSVALLDFQLIGAGRAAYDLAYFVTMSLAPEVASAHERDLFDRWLSGLHAGGVTEADTTGAWDDYRAAALFCLVYPVVASRGMDLDDPRQRALLDVMNQRFGRAVRELDLAEFL